MIRFAFAAAHLASLSVTSCLKKPGFSISRRAIAQRATAEAFRICSCLLMPIIGCLACRAIALATAEVAKNKKFPPNKPNLKPQLNSINITA
jgi:hypothetical protein